MNIRIHKIIPRSNVDGPGERVVVFLQGCTLGCLGCQNRALWPADRGHLTNVIDLAETIALLASRHGNVTISGGEPFQQPQALAQLVYELRRRGVKNILVYTGYTWEELTDYRHPAYGCTRFISEQIDVLVDGRFLAELDDPLISWRGSRNQRPIDVQETLAQGRVVILDWEQPRVIIEEDGSIVFPAGLSPVMRGIGSAGPSRMCGQVREVRS